MKIGEFGANAALGLGVFALVGATFFAGWGISQLMVGQTAWGFAAGAGCAVVGASLIAVKVGYKARTHFEQYGGFNSYVKQLMGKAN